MQVGQLTVGTGTPTKVPLAAAPPTVGLSLAVDAGNTGHVYMGPDATVTVTTGYPIGGTGAASATDFVPKDHFGSAPGQAHGADVYLIADAASQKVYWKAQ